MDIPDTRNTLMGSILAHSLQSLGVSENDQIRISNTFIQDFHGAMSTLESSLKVPVIVVTDYVGGRAIPCYQTAPPQDKPKEIDYNVIARELYQVAWGIVPDKRYEEEMADFLKSKFE